MTQHRFCALIATAATALALAALPANAKEARFRVSTFWITNFIEPHPRSVKTATVYLVTLRPDGRVEERFERTTGNKRANSRAGGQESSLGEIKGVRGETAWRVSDANTLMRLEGRASHTYVVRLRVDGSRCTADVEWRLKPGYTVFEWRHPSGEIKERFTQPSNPTAQCDVL
ncbi:hypothetical protein OIU35_12660 [Boseaceae bacterium BT-24-1]|nr:hypothetical protein [Boseaceae bacterium BT-24-1]